MKKYAGLLSCVLFSNLSQEKSDLIDCVKPVGINQLLPLGKPEDWDSTYATWASVVHEDDSWRLYYSGKDTKGNIRVGLAFSSDGMNWTKYQRNPILDIGPKGNWDSMFVYCPLVRKEKELWKMIFTGCDRHGSMHFQIGLAFSDDGTHWIKSEKNPVYSNSNTWTINSWGKHETEGWGLIYDGDQYSLLYNSVTRRPRQIGLATSKDLICWKELAKPVLPSEGFPWELGYMKYCAYPFRFQENIYILCAVSNMNYGKSRIGLWRIDSFERAQYRAFLGYVLDTSPPWCHKEVDTPFVVLGKNEDEQCKLFCYYGGKSKQNEWHIGVVLLDLAALPKVNPSQLRPY